MKKSNFIYKTLEIILLSILPCGAQSSDSLIDSGAADGFRQVFSIVMRKNHERLKYLKSQKALLEINKEKIQSRRYFSFSPSVTRSGNGKFFPVLTGYVNVNEYVSEFSVVPFEDEYNNFVKFMIPCLNSRKKKITLLTDMIDLTAKRSNYEMEMSIFSELQNLLTSSIQLKKIKDEITLRDTLSKKAESIITLLKNLEESGIIPHRALRTIEFLKDNNALSTDVLYQRLVVYENRLMDEYIMNQLELQEVDKKLSSVFAYILQRKNKVIVDNITYSEQLSRIDREILDLNIRMNSMQEVTISAGPTINANGKFTEIAPGLAAGITVELLPKKKPLIEIASTKSNMILRKDIPHRSIDSTAELQITSAERIFKSCIEEMSLGNISSMYSLTELLNDMFNQQLNLLSLHYEEIESKILSFKKIADFGITSIYQQGQQ
ncbi:MAG TPA: hypothetical protein VHO70_23530 [Chitinispirillaceae bacterium]|nr:hypothetical protein [Chitinispirillaceae bacterium]